MSVKVWELIPPPLIARNAEIERDCQRRRLLLLLEDDIEDDDDIEDGKSDTKAKERERKRGV